MTAEVQLVLATGLVAVAGSLGTAWLASWLQDRRDRKARLRSVRLRELEASEKRVEGLVRMTTAVVMGGTADEFKERATIARDMIVEDDSVIGDVRGVQRVYDAASKLLEDSKAKPGEYQPIDELRTSWIAVRKSIRRRREEIERD